MTRENDCRPGLLLHLDQIRRVHPVQGQHADQLLHRARVHDQRFAVTKPQNPPTVEPDDLNLPTVRSCPPLPHTSGMSGSGESAAHSPAKTRTTRHEHLTAWCRAHRRFTREDVGVEGPRPEWADACCSVCPAQTLGAGQFDVAARPFPGQAFRDDGMRVDRASGVPTCVHPFRVGLPPGAYASEGQPIPGAPRTVQEGEGRRPIPPLGRPQLVRHEVWVPSPEQLVLPEQVEDLEGWLIAVLRTAPDAAMASALGEAETIAAERFSGGQIVAALRRVLATELSR